MKNFFNEEDEKLTWKENSTKELLKTPVFTVTERNCTSKDGLNKNYIVTNAPDWVITIPVHNQKFVMVKQWRHGEKKLSIEFPGGVAEISENMNEAALRELEEETGFKAQKITKLGSFNPNPALFSNHVHVFLAENLIQTGKRHLDSDEFINCVELSEDEILQGMGSEQFPHALMTAALTLYFKYKKFGT